MDDFALYELTVDEARATGLGHWLNSHSRCFGDKGEVGDITEGWCFSPEPRRTDIWLITV